MNNDLGNDGRLYVKGGTATPGMETCPGGSPQCPSFWISIIFIFCPNREIPSVVLIYVDLER